MDEQMTKARLLETLGVRRAAWDALVAQVPADRLTEPGAAGAWSVKDVVAHLANYERWMADRLEEALRGESYVPTEYDMLHFDKRNELMHAQDRRRSLEEVLLDSQRQFQRLRAAVAAHDEAFLIRPQQFENVPEPITIWNMLRSEVYDHYEEHVPSIRAWLAGGRS